MVRASAQWQYSTEEIMTAITEEEFRQLDTFEQEYVIHAERAINKHLREYYDPRINLPATISGYRLMELTERRARPTFRVWEELIRRFQASWRVELTHDGADTYICFNGLAPQKKPDAWYILVMIRDRQAGVRKELLDEILTIPGIVVADAINGSEYQIIVRLEGEPSDVASALKQFREHPKIMITQVFPVLKT